MPGQIPTRGDQTYLKICVLKADKIIRNGESKALVQHMVRVNCKDVDEQYMWSKIWALKTGIYLATCYFAPRNLTFGLQRGPFVTSHPRDHAMLKR